jgi:hypothetical protein
MSIAVATYMLWINLFPLVLAQVAIFFTVARALLTLARRNFGAAYLAIGLVLGMVEASVIGSMKGAMSPRDFMFAAVTGVLSGFVYWLIASRDQDMVAVHDRAEIAGTFR